MSTLWAKLKSLDAYTKPQEDFRVRTLSGGAVTLVSALVMFTLLLSETASYLKGEVDERLFVDHTSSDKRVDINFDITFHKMACDFITVDVMDAINDNQHDIQHDIYKQRLDGLGNNVTSPPLKQEVNTNKTAADTTTTPRCGSCYAARDGCCNTCDEVKEAYHAKGWQVNIEEIEQCKSDSWIISMKEHKNEGCRVYGKVQVAKVAGNFHIAPGDSLRTVRSHVHDLHSMEPTRFDTSHTISHLSFGNFYPGKKLPLDGKRFDAKKGGIMYQYYVKVVPTVYEYMDKLGTLESHQFSVTTNERDLSGGGTGLPGFFVQYEFAPLMVKYTERRQDLSTFLVSLCAIIGGVFTVASLIDAFIYQSSRVIQRKMELNKFT